MINYVSGRALTNYDVYAVLQHTVGAVVDVRNNGQQQWSRVSRPQLLIFLVSENLDRVHRDVAYAYSC